jgi:hypothetical protein
MKTEYKQRRAAKHDAARLKKALVMGLPQECFKNAMTAVLKFPERLLYVEGFIIPKDCTTEPGYTFIHHAWVKDKITGERHELTPSVEDPENEVYIGKEFTRDQLQVFEEPIEHPDERSVQLTKADELELLTVAGYDVELWAVYKDWELIDPTTIDMSLVSDCADYELQEAKGTGHEPSDLTLEGGYQNWHYEWSIREPTCKRTQPQGSSSTQQWAILTDGPAAQQDEQDARQSLIQR